MSNQSSSPMTRSEAERLVASVEHWHHTFEVFPDVWTPGVYQPEFLWNRIGRQDWRGKRVLDIGPADGAMSMWAARAGAQVMAIDHKPKTQSGFAVMERLSGVHVDFRTANVFDLTSMNLEPFEIVLFLGVLYHLPDPLRGLYACRRVCRDRLFLETWYDPVLVPDIPVARYLPSGSDPDHTNFWVPNRAALMAMIVDAGFSVVREESWGERMFVEARVASDGFRLWRLAAAYGSKGDDWPSLLPAQMERAGLAQALTAPLPDASRTPAPSAATDTGRSASFAALGKLAPTADFGSQSTGNQSTGKLSKTDGKSDMQESAIVYAAEPAHEPPLADCGFYHTIEIPGLGVQRGSWDLRPGIDQYLGNIDLRGKRVLEIGAANGFVCFEMERRGADVVALDLPEELTYDAPPFADEYLNRHAYLAGQRRIRNAFWLAHKRLHSKAKLVYGHANQLPASFGQFDVGVIANVLQHLQDPVGAIMQLANASKSVVVTETDWLSGVSDDLKGMIYFDNDNPYTWYQVKPRLVEAVLARMGFTRLVRTNHTQLLIENVVHDPKLGGVGQKMSVEAPHYTIVAHR